MGGFFFIPEPPTVRYHPQLKKKKKRNEENIKVCDVHSFCADHSLENEICIFFVQG